MIFTREMMKEASNKIDDIRRKMLQWNELILELDASLEQYRDVLDPEDIDFMENEKKQLTALHLQSWKKVKNMEHNLKKLWRPQC